MEEKTFALNEEQEKGLFSKFKAWFNNEVEAEELERAKAKEWDDLKAELEKANERLAELDMPEEPSEEEVSEEPVKEEPSEEMVIEAKVEEQVKAALKDIAKPVEFKNTKATAPKKVWEQHLSNFQNIIK